MLDSPGPVPDASSMTRIKRIPFPSAPCRVGSGTPLLSVCEDDDKCQKKHFAIIEVLMTGLTVGSVCVLALNTGRKIQYPHQNRITLDSQLIVHQGREIKYGWSHAT